MEYQIGDFAKISRLGIKTLRYYHKIGLLKPTRVDKLTGYRYYDESCMVRVRTIQRLKELEFPLAEIREILAHHVEDDHLVEAIIVKMREIENKIAGYQSIHDRMAAFLRGETAVPAPQSEAVEKEIEDMLIASIRFRGNYTDIGEKIERLYQVCGVFAVGKPFSLYYDDQAMQGNADIEVCLLVSSHCEKDEITCRILPGGKFISVMHKGAYERIWLSYQVMVNYFNRNHLKPVLPTREIYLKGFGLFLPGIPENFLTEIQFGVGD